MTQSPGTLLGARAASGDRMDMLPDFTASESGKETRETHTPSGLGDYAWASQRIAYPLLI